MTTIATDGTMMAADSRLTNAGQTIINDAHQKLAKTKAGWVIGICGNADLLRSAVEALDKGKEPVIDGESTMLALLPGGELRRYESDGWFVATAPDALGTGHRFALTAMDCGKSAEEAVSLAIKRDPFSGGPVQRMTPGRPARPRRKPGARR